MKLRTEDISWRDVEDEVVILDERTWKYVHLNGTATLLWRALVNGASSEAELTEALTAAYPSAVDSAPEDIAAFVADLQAREYLQA